MNKTTKHIAIIGYGFVGKAVAFGFPQSNIVKHSIIDPAVFGNHVSDLKGKHIDASFVCVPTPMDTDGSVNSSILEEIVQYLLDNVSGLIVIKSTVIPSVLSKFDDDRVVYNPEFLTERNAEQDFVNPEMHIFGGEKSNTSKLHELYQNYSICNPCPSFHMTREEASFVKYGINCFLASKVSWFNQYFDTITSFSNNVDYDTIIRAMTADPRIGSSHMKVPGFDGKRGFGLGCFPKDTMAMLSFAKDNGQDLSILKEVILTNIKYRSQYELDDREKEQNVQYNKELI